MGDRKQGLSIVLDSLGAGTVIRNMPSENLVQPNQTGVISPTPSPQTTNVRLFEGECVRRNGLTALGLASGAGDEIHGTFVAVFDATARHLIRGYANAGGVGAGQVQRYNESTTAWESIMPSGTDVGNAQLSQPWSFAMCPNPANKPSQRMLFANQTTPIYGWLGSGTAAALTDANAPKGPVRLVSFLSRAFALNVESAQGDRVATRMQWSIVSDCTDWTSIGSGNLDLSDDPYPIVNGLVIGGRLVVFKGGADGGSIYVCTPTGISAAPIRIDAINPGTGVGVVVPRSVVPVTSTLAFFLGHDAAYLYDGVRALLPFAEGVARDITSRLNYAAVDTGFAFYNDETREVELHVATGSNTVPNESWHFDIRGKRAYGPMEYGKNLLSAGIWLPQGMLSWQTWGQAAGRTWDTLTDTGGTEYYQWDLVSSGLGSNKVVYGADDGFTYQSTSTDTDDDGTDIDCTYKAPAVTPGGWMIPGTNKQIRQLRTDDILVLREIHLRHKSTATWTPIIEVSTDGTTWDKVSDDTTVVDTKDRLLTKTYYISNLCDPSTWFQVRLRNTDGDLLNAHGLILNFTYAGNYRNE